MNGGAADVGADLGVAFPGGCRPLEQQGQGGGAACGAAELIESHLPGAAVGLAQDLRHLLAGIGRARHDEFDDPLGGRGLKMDGVHRDVEGVAVFHLRDQPDALLAFLESIKAVDDPSSAG